MVDSIRDQVAIVGVGTSRQGQLPEMEPYGIAAEALQAALADAGLQKSDIDGISIRPLDPIGASWQNTARALGLDPRFGFTASYGGASTSIAVQNAAMAVHHGLATTVAVLYSTNSRTTRNRFGNPRYEHHAPYGYFSPGARAAMAFNRYMHDYCGVAKDTEEAMAPYQRKLGAIAVAARRHASLNPIAYHYEGGHAAPFSAEDYMQQRYICWPLRRPDYTLISDGGGCLIVTSAERARLLPKPPVYVMGMGQGHQLRSQEHPSFIMQRGAQETASAEALWRNTGYGPSDMDAMYVYDSFSVLTLLAIENYGFCKPGEGLDFIAGGRTEFDGAFPVNTNGGHLAESYIGGILHYVEAVRQIRGEAGDRQIKKKLELVLTCGEGSGGVDAGALVLRKG